MVGCATVPVTLSGPLSAPLKEQALSPGDRAADEAASASTGADGARALYYLGLDQAAAGDWPGAGRRWQQVVKQHPGSDWDRLAMYMTGAALEKVGEGGRAFVQYQQLLTGTAVADLPERGRAACLRLASSLPEADLKALEQGGYADPEFQPWIRLRLLELAQAAGRADEVRKGTDDYLRRWPHGPGLDRLEALSRALEASVPVDPHAVGLLIPRSGPLAPFGEQVRQGAQLAFDQANLGLDEKLRWRLTVADEGAQPKDAQAAVKELIDKDQVIGILGPLGSESAAELIPLVASRRVPLFSSSAARGDLAEASPWFFRNTLTPEKQAMALADELVLQRKVTRVAMLSPDNGYGQAMALAFAKRLQELGAGVAVAVTYAPGTRDFHDALLALGGVDPGEAKTADGDEKREQQSKVEEASTGLGGTLLEQAQALTAPAGVTETPRLKVLVLPFAQDAPAALLNAGHAFADRFSRTLAQLPELDVQPQALTDKLLKVQGLDPDHLTLPQIGALGAAAGADVVLGGATAVDLTATSRAKANRLVFALVAQLVDPVKLELVAQRRFTWTKYKAPEPNPLGLQALFLPSTAEDVARVIPALMFFDLRLPLLGGDQWDRPELADHLDQLQGSIYAVPWWPDAPTGVAKDFDQAYRQAYAARPGQLAAQAYDAARIVLRCLAGGAADRASLRSALSRVSDFDGASGRTSFEGHQDAVKRPALIEVLDGAQHMIEER
jgi:ABC-type branched-subunit amino acid transport system substrate-binding protein